MSLKPAEVRLGQLLVQHQWCTLRNVTLALRRQEELRARGTNRPLGRILVEQGCIDEETLRDALSKLGALHLECRSCAYTTRVRKYARGKPYSCPRCKKPMELAEPNPVRGASGAAAAKKPAPAAEPDGSAGSPPNIARPPETADGDSGEFVGRVLGGCRLLEKIAQGGMGVIFKATQLNLNRIVAVKVLAEDLSDDESFVRRFIEEARAAGQLSHHNIVHINDVGEHRGVFYFIMEYVDGENLKAVLQRSGPLSVERALVVALQVCYALRHAHERGIIHRDIKPENVMITRDGVVKLADLGLAKRIGAGAGDGLTQAGSIFGTPYYMAPEQAKDFSNVDQRSDIYSLGVTLFKAISGRVPFDGRSPIEIMVKALDGRHPPLRSLRDGVPELVEKLVDRMMARRQEDRFQGIDEVISELKRILGAHASRSRSEKLLTFQ